MTNAWKIWVGVDILRNCWNGSETSVPPKRYFSGRFWKSMLRALIMTQKQKYPSSSSRRSKIKSIMRFTVSRRRRLFTQELMRRKSSWDWLSFREAVTAKNYLDEKELHTMGQLVSDSLDFMERQAERAGNDHARLGKASGSNSCHERRAAFAGEPQYFPQAGSG